MATMTELSAVNSYVSRVWLTCPGAGLGMVPDRFHELIEERTAIVGARRRLGMVLHGKDRLAPMPKALDRPIVQIDVRNLEFAGSRNLVLGTLNRESVVLRRYKYLSRKKIPHRVVTAPVPIGEFDRLSPKGEAQKLVPQANAESGEA